MWLAGLSTPFLYLSIIGCLNLTIVLTLASQAGIDASTYIPFLGLFLTSALAFLALTICLAMRENETWEKLPDKDEEKDQILKVRKNYVPHKGKRDVLFNQIWINP